MGKLVICSLRCLITSESVLYRYTYGLAGQRHGQEFEVDACEVKDRGRHNVLTVNKFKHSLLKKKNNMKIN